MTVKFTTVSNFASPYSGILNGNRFSVELKGQQYPKNKSSETLRANIDDIQFKLTPNGVNSGLGLDVFNKDGELKSSITFDKEGKVLYLCTDRYDGKVADYWPQDVQITSAFNRLA